MFPRRKWGGEKDSQTKKMATGAAFKSLSIVVDRKASFTGEKC